MSQRAVVLASGYGKLVGLGMFVSRQRHVFGILNKRDHLALHCTWVGPRVTLEPAWKVRITPSKALQKVWVQSRQCAKGFPSVFPLFERSKRNRPLRLVAASAVSLPESWSHVVGIQPRDKQCQSIPLLASSQASYLHSSQAWACQLSKVPESGVPELKITIQHLRYVLITKTP
jgi:hypothetical protein